MDIEELRQLIRTAVRAAIVAAPLAGCGAAPAATAEPEPPEPIRLQTTTESSGPETATAVPEQDRVLTEEEWNQRWSSTGGGGGDVGIQVIEGRPLQGPGGLMLASAGAAKSPLAQQWRDAALREHASIASFARATIELMEVGAPLALLERYQRAGADEAAHARMCFELAEHFGGEPLRPGRLEVPPAREPSLTRLAVDVYREGALNETIAAWLASYACERCDDPRVSPVLERIACDEAGHAALAWQTLRWAVTEEPAPVRVALERESVRLPRFETDGLGLLDQETSERQAMHAYRELVVPALAELLRA